MTGGISGTVTDPTGAEAGILDGDHQPERIPYFNETVDVALGQIATASIKLVVGNVAETGEVSAQGCSRPKMPISAPPTTQVQRAGWCGFTEELPSSQRFDEGSI